MIVADSWLTSFLLSASIGEGMGCGKSITRTSITTVEPRGSRDSPLGGALGAVLAPQALP